MLESPFTCKFLKLVRAIDYVSCVGVLRFIITNYFLRNTVPCKDLLHIVYQARSSVLSQKFKFKVFGIEVSHYYIGVSSILKEIRTDNFPWKSRYLMWFESFFALLVPKSIADSKGTNLVLDLGGHSWPKHIVSGKQ